MRSFFIAAGALALGTTPAAAEDWQMAALDTVIITAAPRLPIPNAVESVTAPKIADTINAVNTEDALKYLPNVLVRKRHIGDTQAPITTRTSGVGASARSLIFADGVLLSALIANNNTIGSPRWSMVAPEEIERIDVIYGPFAAGYAGNSIGSVIEITTRMPTRLEITAQAEGAIQSFGQYGTQEDEGIYQLSAGIGDKIGKLAFRLAANHLDSHSQPLAYVTALRPASPGGGTPVSGGFTDLNRTGAPIAVVGAGGIEHQVEDNVTAKFALDLTPDLSLHYTLGVFAQDDKASVRSFLSDAAGNPVYQGNVNIGGYSYSIPGTAFASTIYSFKQTHVMQALALRSDPQERFSFEVIGSVYSYLNDTQRMPGMTAAGLASGPGSITDMDGTGWATLDAKGLWRGGAHQLTFGAHGDRYELVNVRYNTSDWLHGGRGTVANAISGKTKTVALWAQDEWRLPRDVALTLGGRYEYWRAYDGTNFGPGLSVSQPGRTATGFSPKGTIAWGFAPNWTATGSFGVAYRFPTVAELYQAVTTGVVQASPNPTLRPERALSGEIALERRFTDGKIRLSLFEESLSDALIAQNTLLPGSTTTLVTFVQNVDKVESRGIELVGEKDDVLLRGLALQGSVTFVDSTIVKDSVLPVAIGKQTPQVPSWRATLVATYRPDAQWVFTAAARYSNRVYATIDNSDIYTHTYQGFDSYFVVDLRARYAIDDHWSAALGIDNVNDDAYFLFHPFPQRTFHMEVKCAF